MKRWANRWPLLLAAAALYVAAVRTDVVLSGRGIHGVWVTSRFGMGCLAFWHNHPMPGSVAAGMWVGQPDGPAHVAIGWHRDGSIDVQHAPDGYLGVRFITLLTPSPKKE